MCRQMLSLPLDIPAIVESLGARFAGNGKIRVLPLGRSSQTQYIVNSLGAKSSAEVVVVEKPPLFDATPSLTSLDGDSIAIVGMSGRGPGSDTLDEYWERIIGKQDMAVEVPKDRFDIDEFYCTEHGRNKDGCKMTGRWGCFMNNPGHFDSRFFRISPREAMLMDPGHRHFLMSAYEALEQAGYSDGPAATINPARVGALFGQCTDDWRDASHPTLGCDAYTLQGVQRAFGPGRLAWHFKWEGPTYAVDSACASTTSSIHLACMSLLSRDIDMAVVGASSVLSYPHSFTCLSMSGVLSDTGNCKTYRDDADGYCRGEFVGSVVLKRLRDAVDNNDRILGVVKGSGRNHSGNATSITTSDPGAQERLFRKVLRNANMAPETLSYVEMHGTGTQVGDVAELTAVGNLFKGSGGDMVSVGSNKANVGHSEAAAGMSALLKIQPPPQAGMPHALNPGFPPLASLNLAIPSEPQPFEQGKTPRRILLNNFDAAGGNACLVLEEYVGHNRYESDDNIDPRSTHVVAISSRTAASHSENIRRFSKYLRTRPNTRLKDVAYSTTARRLHHPIRSAYIATSTTESMEKLEVDVARQDSQSAPAKSLSSTGPDLVFVFSGQGSHYAGMGAELYSTNRAFRQSIDLCAQITERHGFAPFLPLITDPLANLDAHDTVQTQLAVLAVEIGLARFWKSLGLQPAIVMGHSLGEYAALHVAGVLSLVDALYLVGKRAQLLLERCELDGWNMLALPTSLENATELMSTNSACCVSCVNGPNATATSGPKTDMSTIATQCKGKGISSKLLPIPYGFHSAQMDQILPTYVALVHSVTYSAPRVPEASTMLAGIVDKPGVFGAQYLGEQTRCPVNFVGTLQAVEQMMSNPFYTQHLVQGLTWSKASPAYNVLSTAAGSGKDGITWSSVSQCLAGLYTHGAAIDWPGLHAPYVDDLELLALPSYAWDMKDYWVTYSAADEPAHDKARVLAVRPPMLSTCAQYVVRDESSAGNIQMTVGTSLAEPSFSALIDGHRMQQLPICPGSVFCEAAVATATHALRAHGREGDANPLRLALREVLMLRPLAPSLVGPDGELLTTIRVSKNSSNIGVTWKASSAPSATGKPATTHELGRGSLVIGDDTQSVQARWDRISYFIQARMEDVTREARDGRGHCFQPEIFYTLFAPTVRYSDAYKNIRNAYVSEDFMEAVAKVVLPENSRSDAMFKGTNPYWTESVVHLAGFVVNANVRHTQKSTGTLFISGGFDTFEQTAALEAGQTYFSYARVSEPDKATRLSDVFIFTVDHRLVAQCVELKFQEISTSILQQSLSGTATAHGPTAQSLRPSPGGAETLKTHSGVSNGEKATEVVIKQDPPPDPGTTPSRTGVEAPGQASNVLDAVLEIVSEATGMDVSELGDDFAFADIGVDSIMAIEVSSRVTDVTGVPLLPTFVVDHLTIGDLRRAMGGPSPSSSSSDSAGGSAATEASSLSSDTEAPSVSEDVIIDICKDEPVASENSDSSTQLSGLSPPTGQTSATSAGIEESTSPLPSVRLSMLQSGKKSKQGAAQPPPFYFIADGTGSIGSYIHIPSHLTSNMAIYGIDSPFLRCPDRLTPEIGIPGVAKLMVDALAAKQIAGTSFWIGGFSGGAMIAYEVCRQLVDLGYAVDALLLIDMCAPRTRVVTSSTDVGLAMYRSVSDHDDSGAWASTERTFRHLDAIFSCVATYVPTSPSKAIAKRTAIIWASKGMIHRFEDSTSLQRLLTTHGIPTTPYDGFMVDNKMGAQARSLFDKGPTDLGPNGWDRVINGTEAPLCSSVDGDHLELFTPECAPVLVRAMEKAFDYFRKD
ncbi:hypothetical protein PRZ48_011272 [Zasmidium cellare]|uniref:Polyketide synthase n=1 Tax=Zasmidium cellare TaxID=395010 RepID=A0ABR0EBU8_ZASCE|nr:hypothetical protein PRZ48_011272 [Zasmidium cellare]